ncbi:hypothetical protein BJX64DRAFT_49507 [Aspergillus heterothallicus]
MGSGRLLGLAWHLHRSGSSSLDFSSVSSFTPPALIISSPVNVPYAFLFSSPLQLYLFSSSILHLTVLHRHSSFIPLPVFLVSLEFPCEFSKFKYRAIATTLVLIATSDTLSHMHVFLCSRLAKGKDARVAPKVQLFVFCQLGPPCTCHHSNPPTPRSTQTGILRQHNGNVSDSIHLSPRSTVLCILMANARDQV